MKVFCLLLLLTLSSLISFGQFPASPNARDENNLRTGYWTMLYDSANHIVTNPDAVVYYRLVLFEKGKPVGKVRDFYRTYNRQWDGYLSSVEPDVKYGETNYYFENGHLQYHAFYVNDKFEGPFQQYNEKGVQLSDGFMKNDLSEGKWIFYFPGGAKLLECNRSHGLDNGLSVEYYENGNVYERGQKVAGEKTGFWETIYLNGTIAKKANYSHNKLEGPYQFFKEDGSLESEGLYKDDLKSGPWTFYSATGKKESEGSFENDLKVGTWKSFYGNGQERYVGPWRAGVQTGDYIFYHENGQVSGKGKLLNNFYDGYWDFYFDNGNLARQASYERDSLQGHCIYYHKTGGKKSEGNFHLEKKNGRWSYYDEAGKLTDTENLTEDVLNGEALSYFPNGKVRLKSNYKDGELDGEKIETYENGQIKSAGLYRDDLREGEWKWFFENGQLDSRYFYVHGKYTGPWIVYYPNGQVESVGTGKDGLNEGKYKNYYRNGKLKKEGNIVHGLNEGKWVSYDSVKGKKISSGNYVHNKLDGRWLFYNAEGKKDDISYYRDGFWETYTNVCDSINRTIEQKQYDLALKHIEWLKRVIHRDWPSTSTTNSQPLLYHANIAYDLADYPSALNWYELYEQSVKKLEGDTSNHYILALNGIALCKIGLGLASEAIPIYDDILKRETPAAEDYPTAVANKAYAVLKTGHEAEAYASLTEAWEKYKTTEGEASEHALAVLSEMGFFDAHWNDHYEKAIGSYKLYLATLKKSKPKSDPRYQSVLQEIAYCSKLLVRRSEAIDWYIQVIELQDSLEQTHDIQYLENVYDLANQLTNAGKDDTAMVVLDTLLVKIHQDHLENSSLHARALDAKATLEYYFNHYATAIALWKQSIGILEDRGDTKDIFYTGMLQGLGLAIYGSGANTGKEAEPWIVKAVDVTLRNLGEKSLQYQRLLLSLGNFYREEKRFVQSDSILHQAGRIIAKYSGTDNEAYAEYLHKQGQVYADQESYEVAISYFQRALVYQRANQDNSPFLYTAALISMGKAQRFSGQYEAAEQTIREEIAAYEKEKKEHSEEYLRARTQLAHVLKDQNLFSEAEKIYLSVLKGQEALTGKKSIDYGYRLENLGVFYYTTGDYKKAEARLLEYQALTETSAYKVSWQAMEVSVKLANLYDALGRAEEAEALYKKSLVLASRVYGGQSNDFARKTRIYAQFCEDHGRKADAAKQMTIAANVASNIYGNESLIYSFYIIDQARIFLSMGRNAEAEKLLEKARAITTLHKNDAPEDFKNALEELGNFYSAMGRNDEAEAVFNELLKEIVNKEGRHIAYARIMTAAAGVEYASGDFDKALQRLHEALPILDEEFDPGHGLVIDAHNSLGLIALGQRNYDEAERQFNYCIDKEVLKKQTVTNTYAIELHNLATAKTNKGQFAEAEKLFHQSIDIRKTLNIKASIEEQASLQDNLAILYQAWGKYDLAEKQWKEVLQKLQLFIRQNFPFMSDYEKAKFWQKNKEDFEDFNTFALLAKKQNPVITGTMYDLQLETKGILLNASNKIRKRIYASHDSTQINLYYNWIQSREQLAKEYTAATSAQKSKKADSLEHHINSLEKELSLNAEELRGGKSIGWKDVQKNLGPDDAAIEMIRFHYFDRHLTDSVVYAALVVTSETKVSPLVAVLPGGDYLEKRAYRFYRNAIVGQLDDTVSYKQFWSFVAPLIKNKKKIFFSPDGVYNQVNLKTLKVSGGKYLMDQQNIVLVSSTRDVVAFRNSKRLRVLPNASLIGNPRFFIGRSRVEGDNSQRSYSEEDRSGIAELPGTKTEIETVESMLKNNGWKVNAFEETTASEANIKQLSASRVLHLATHGFFQDRKNDSWSTQDPMLRSGILLSGAANFIQNHEETNGENGILTAYEASNLSLEGTELVVLSACETARGEIQQGEGVYGLQRAFISAGAETLVMSLWKVDDAATEKLMSLFYANWMKGMDKNEALDQAQQELKKTYPHPYYWGAFVMMKG